MSTFTITVSTPLSDQEVQPQRLQEAMHNKSCFFVACAALDIPAAPNYITIGL
jgi:hypothetical protein